jgi:hypothetical protein
MHKLKTKNFLALTCFTLAFAFGVALFYVLEKPSFRTFTQPTSLCAAMKNRISDTKSEASNYVHLTGYLSGKHFLYFSDFDQNACDDSYAEVVLVNEQKLSVESQKLIQEIRRLTDEDTLASVKVEIIGSFEARELLGFAQSRFVITAIQIMPKGSLEVLESSAFGGNTKISPKMEAPSNK